jgi:hypothetical protein
MTMFSYTGQSVTIHFQPAFALSSICLTSWQTHLSVSRSLDRRQSHAPPGCTLWWNHTIQSHHSPASDADDESFDAEDYTPPDLFQHYTKTLLSDNISPKLYLVNVKAIVGPTVVVRDVVGHPSDVSVSDRRSQDTYIFMAVRRNEWASRWEHKVDLAYQEKNEDGAESTEDENDSATIKDRRMNKRMHGTA